MGWVDPDTGIVTTGRANGNVLRERPDYARGPTRRQSCLAADELELELIQLTLDLVGLADPTGISDAAGAALEACRGNGVSAALSAIAVVPYIGDLAKAGKLPRYARTLERTVEMARGSRRMAERIAPLMSRLDEVLRLLPEGVDRQVDSIRDAVRRFLVDRRVLRAADEFPDIGPTFYFREYIHGTHKYREATGRLGVPGRVKKHRTQTAQRGVSSGTGDDAGHLIGNRFGAPGDQRNLSMQNFVANRWGTYRRLEDYWADALKQGTGIEVRVTDIYRAGEPRPFARRVEWNEIAPNGERRSESLDFMNSHTARSREKQEIPPTPGVPEGGARVFDFMQEARRRGRNIQR
jgi:hypothetical protein